MANHTSKPDSSKPAKAQVAAIASTATAGAPGRKPNSGPKQNSLIGRSVAPVAAATRQAMIAEAAYYIAEQRGFQGGRDVEDWLLAEKQIDTLFSS